MSKRQTEPHKPPSFQWYPKDCDTDERVRMMDDREYGFYGRCLNHSWLNDGLPGNIDDIARALNRSRIYVEKIWQRISECFPLCDDGRRRNPKQEKQRQESKEFTVSRSKAGTAGAKKRWHSNGTAMRLPMAKHSSSSASASANLTTPPVGLVELSISCSTPWPEALAITVARLHKRHPAHRKCSLKTVEQKLESICKALPATDRVACLLYIDAQHVKWCESIDWTKDSRSFVKSLEAWLNPTKRLWENEPTRPANTSTGVDYPVWVDKYAEAK